MKAYNDYCLRRVKLSVTNKDDQNEIQSWFIKILEEYCSPNNKSRFPLDVAFQILHALKESAAGHNRTKRMALVDGIKYHKLGAEYYYAQELFQQEELKGYLKNTLESKKSVYEYIVYDSVGIEKAFAEDLEANEAVKVYAKLPSWFKVPTPLGTYNPDWAVLIEQDGEEKLYFVVETKGSTWWDDLRHHEGAKIKCGEKHFEEIKSAVNPAKFIRAANVGDLMKNLGSLSA